MKSPNSQKLQAIVAILLCVSPVFSVLTAAEGLPVHQYEVIKPFLDKHCVSCHGPEKQKGKFRVDTLGKFIKSQSVAEDWQEMLDLINTGEMPPPDEPRPTDNELKAVLEALYQTTSDARDVIVKAGAGKMRRMNRREYVNTLEDRLGIRPKEELLPVDPGDFGFDTFRKELVVTPTQIDGYMAAGEELVGRLIQSNLSPKTMSTSAKFIFGDLSSYIQTKQVKQEGRKKKEEEKATHGNDLRHAAGQPRRTDPPKVRKSSLQRKAVIHDSCK